MSVLKIKNGNVWEEIPAIGAAGLQTERDLSLFQPVLLLDKDTEGYVEGGFFNSGSLTPVQTATTTNYRAYGIYDVEPGQVIRFEHFKGSFSFYNVNGGGYQRNDDYLYGNLHDGEIMVPEGKYKLGVNLTAHKSAGGSTRYIVWRDTPSEAEKAQLPVKITNMSLQTGNVLNSDTIRLIAPLKGKTIVNFGDSIFGKSDAGVTISSELAKLTGATVYNCAFGGCRMSQHANQWDAFSMYRLAYAVANGDFSLQDDAISDSSWSDMPSYFPSHLAPLKTLDFKNVDIVTIAYGANDFTGSVGLDNENDAKDTTKFAGALRYSIETLLTAYPNLKIYVLGLTYRWWMDSAYEFTYDSNTYTVNGRLMRDFLLKTKEVALEYNLPFIDNYNIGIGKYSRSYYFNFTDGTHHAPRGKIAIAENIARAMLGTQTPSPTDEHINGLIDNKLGVIENGLY